MLVLLHPGPKLCKRFQLGVKEEVASRARPQRPVLHVRFEEVYPTIDWGHSEGDGKEGGQVGGVESDQDKGHEPPHGCNNPGAWSPGSKVNTL